MSGQGNMRGAGSFRPCAGGMRQLRWLCGAFGFERKMLVPGEGGRVAHAELTLGNGMIMLGDAETEYGRLVVAPTKGEAVTQGIITPGPRPS